MKQRLCRTCVGITCSTSACVAPVQVSRVREWSDGAAAAVAQRGGSYQANPGDGKQLCTITIFPALEASADGFCFTVN